MSTEQAGLYQRAIELPVLPAKDLVIFPHIVIPFHTESSPAADVIHHAMDSDRLLFFAYRDTSENAGADAYMPVGTVVKIIQLFKLKDHAVRILGEALYRARITDTFISSEDITYVRIDPVQPKAEQSHETLVLADSIRTSFTTYADKHKRIPEEFVNKVKQSQDPDALIDTIASHMPLAYDVKIGLLQLTDRKQRLQQMSILLNNEIELIDLQQDIQKRVKDKLERAQKEYFLGEQIRQINKELGKEQDIADEADELLERIMDRQPPQHVIDKAQKETHRLKRLQLMAPESGVLRTYLEWLGDLPWSEETEDSLDLQKAKEILDHDHYHMTKPKERILDYLAVKRIQPRMKGPILCLVGPPGTGKTSLGRSIARTMGRSFIRVSLGGVHDEAEIRGHRKTYVGALPGKIIQSIKKAGTKNPVFLLDEIDKMGADFRGDPASAMLEVLDPEQNSNFTDHYLEIPYDLSEVLFIATANSLHTIPAALRDRMEIIEIPGYSDIEKYHIADRFLIPRQIEENGLTEAQITFRRSAVMSMIHDYTMESGVRQLERTTASVMRKVARECIDQDLEVSLFKKQVTAASLKNYLGRATVSHDQVFESDICGVANGLAWTEMGGRILTVEVVLYPGDGKLILTGNLGDVMKESARISLSYLKSHAEELDLDIAMIDHRDIHIHIPQGAIPKDGPSAGITLTTALYSAFSGRPVPSDVSMTGEMTLTGSILPIGGVKEKILASYRHHITRILIPAKNEPDTREDIPKNVYRELDITYVTHITEAVKLLFGIDPDTTD